MLILCKTQTHPSGNKNKGSRGVKRNISIYTGHYFAFPPFYCNCEDSERNTYSFILFFRQSLISSLPVPRNLTTVFIADASNTFEELTGVLGLFQYIIRRLASVEFRILLIKQLEQDKTKFCIVIQLEEAKKVYFPKEKLYRHKNAESSLIYN